MLPANAINALPSRERNETLRDKTISMKRWASGESATVGTSPSSSTTARSLLDPELLRQLGPLAVDQCFRL